MNGIAEVVDVDDMQEPVACFTCSETVELADCAFFTAACHCYVFAGSCSHGVCKRCEAAAEGQAEHEEGETG